ncbi:P2 [Zucchini aphid-borne yellows virus]|uniref:P2 n=1 Tax=Zucchini aphid-borne yellows virus TaxID=2527960 RepID=A0A411NPY8_9VIRU|nr:P2 [Zucchini aphid-borne yellows virus]
MVSIKIFLFALFCFSCLSSLEGSGTMVHGSFATWSPVTNFSSFVLPWDIIPPEPVKVTKCGCLPPTPLVDRTYTDLKQAILQKLSQDIKKYSITAREASAIYLDCFLTKLKQFGFLVLEQFLWGLAKLWSSLILVSISSIWFLVVNFTIPVLALALCYILTMFMVRVMRFLFGGLPVLMITGIWSLLRNCFVALSSKPRCIYEKAIDGFKSFKIPQSPPKSCVLPISYASGCHAGYASCVKLYNGENALLTATHIVDIKDPLYVNSVKGVSSKIPLSNFKIIKGSVKGDITLLRGPPNWEGALGCKATTMVTAQQLSKCDATIYALEKSGWTASHAKLVGSDGLNVQVLSNTDGGHSGSPYFNGKFILGVHSGASVENNYNLMAPIPHLPGLTSSLYVFETTAPQGRIFSEPDLQQLAREYEEGKKIIKFKSTSGKNWADYGEDDDEDFFDSKPVFHEASSDFPFKRRARHRPRNKRRRQLHPKDRQRRWERDDGEDNLLSRGEDQPRINREAGCGPDFCESYEETNPSPPQESEDHQATAREFEAYFESLYEWEVSTPTCEVPGFRYCGKLPCYYHPKQKEESSWGKTLVGNNPALGEKTRGFGWPQFGPKAELTSLKLQAARWLERAQSAQIPSDAARERVIEKTVGAYKSCITNGPAATRGNTLLWDDFLEDFKSAVFSLELDAGIGVPYIGYGRPTHRGWVEDPQLLPVLARLTFIRLQKMLEVSFEHLSPVELVQHGLCDPIRLFVKGEPHKQSKLDEGRYRLIMSVSLVDQLVARVLFQNQNKREIALWRAIPSKPGFGLSTDEQVLDFTESLARQVGTNPADVVANWSRYLTPTDCSGFDWSVAEWMLLDDMEVRNRLTLDLTPALKRLRSCWVKCIANSVFCLSDGTLLEQTTPGVQKSGSYNTSSSNSRIRVMAAYHAGADWAIAMGDDALESNPADLEAYKQLGFKVEKSGQLEFCSHIFRAPGLALPVNENKMIYKLVFGYNPGSGNPEVVANYLAACFSVLNELRHDPDSVELLYSWLVHPVLPQKIPQE